MRSGLADRVLLCSCGGGFLISTGEMSQAELGHLSDRIRGFLSSGKPAAYLKPSHLEYAQRRFEQGLAGLVDRLARMGCPTDGTVLDVGSGAGNWSIAQGCRIEGQGAVHAFDPAEGYVRLGSEIASSLDLDGVRFCVGRAEDPAAYIRADFAMTNSSMMWIDIDPFIPLLRENLEAGGYVYGNYTTTAGRIEKAAAGVARGEPKVVRHGLSSIYTSALTKVGLRPSSSAFAVPAVQMFDLFSIYGFELIEQPGIHDWKPTNSRDGIVDFIMRRGDTVRFRAGDVGDREVRRLFDAGAFTAVISATSSDGTSSPESRDLRARALLARGHDRAAATIAASLGKHAVAPFLITVQQILEKKARVSGLGAVASGDFAPEHRSVVEFCLGAVQLRAGAPSTARPHFEHAAELSPSWSGGWVGGLIAMLDEGIPLAAGFAERFATMLEAAELGLCADDDLKTGLRTRMETR